MARPSPCKITVTCQGPHPRSRAIRRGVFTSVKDLNTKIRAFIDGWDDRSHPFVWTKTANQILAKANC